MRATAGSSPLARGLRVPERCLGGQRRIIPARAGFTGVSWSVRGTKRDHPRSRGVYASACTTRVPLRGSSPLARGLPHTYTPSPHLDGIIPARAGFTGPPYAGRALSADHPRSRGVYASRRVSPRGTAGSSPLARGLRAPRHGLREQGRIIPARAGFTPTASHGDSHTRDHPRSRGVYRPARRERAQSHGSSPLARGLPRRHERACGRGGIIPARAGFTNRILYPGKIEKDHPRSRGVYYRPRTPVFNRLGSSPLARGLRAGGGCGWRENRIIPARAGFTHTIFRLPETFPDHPRSRGVYGVVLTDPAGLTGSSPLARGLLAVYHSALSVLGIIPARAGFTHPRRRP